jgi:3,4-dihydroxy 2-butanone 4-phosphate synthase/GTP cyclohydrolase II
MTRTRETIERIRAYALAKKMRPATLARAAGLHPNSLRRMHQGDWNPSAETLERLEATLSPDFDPDASVEVAA